MRQVLYNLKNTLFCLSIFALLTNCNGQSKQVENCQASYKSAELKLSKHVQNSNRALIKEAIEHLDTALKCKETRFKAIGLKITLLFILENNKEGYLFIESLGENDFAAKYKKKMYYNLFRALEYESQSDTANRNKLLKEIAIDIENYIQQENLHDDKIDEEAYYDLFLVKSKMLSKERINQEIDFLRSKYPDKQNFFDVLKESFDEATTDSYPTPTD